MVYVSDKDQTVSLLTDEVAPVSNIDFIHCRLNNQDITCQLECVGGAGGHT